MAAVINTNVSSLNAQRNLNTSQSQLATSLQRLSSGLRINSAKDDAAGLAISQRFSTQVRGMDQAARNANDGISLAQTAEGALGEIGNNLQRIRELAVQSRNATNSADDRAALQKEVDQLKSEISRVAETTNFNGTNLLDGSFTAQSFQVGANQGETINIAEIANASIDKLGSWTTATMAGGALGTADLAKGDLTINGKAIGAATSDAASIAAAINAESSSTGVSATATNAGIDLGAFTDIAATADAVANLSIGGVDIYDDADVAAGKNEGQLVADIIAQKDTLAARGITLNADASTLDELNLTKSDGGNVDVVFNTTASAGAFGNVTAGEATFKGTVSLTSYDSGSFEIGGASAANAGFTAGTTGTVKTTNGFENLDISTVGGADEAIVAMDAALKSVNDARADLGAIQNRFSSVVTNLQTSSENLSAARSRIMDADFASETANLTRGQILQQAGTAMLAQANSLPNGVLALLRG